MGELRVQRLGRFKLDVIGCSTVPLIQIITSNIRIIKYKPLEKKIISGPPQRQGQQQNMEFMCLGESHMFEEVHAGDQIPEYKMVFKQNKELEMEFMVTRVDGGE